MIVTGRSLCLPSVSTVQELFLVARDAGAVPDVSLDPVLCSFLSPDSSAALRHHHLLLRRGLGPELGPRFTRGLGDRLGAQRVALGGVGVVALALALLFDQVALQVRGQGSAEGGPSPRRPPWKTLFGISATSRIGRICSSYLTRVPAVANDPEAMAETSELHDTWLKLELLDHYERMTTRKRMSSIALQQWLTGAALHLHLRIHQVRLHSVPVGSAESLRLSYKTAYGRLVQVFTSYLRRNIQETAAPAPAPRGPSRGNVTGSSCSAPRSFNVSRVGPGVLPLPASGGGRLCGARGENLGDKEEGLLVIEPWRNVSHRVHHRPCQSPAIQEALVSRIMQAQDLQRNRDFFLYPEQVLQQLLEQRDDFLLETNWTRVSGWGSGARTQDST